MIGEPHSAQKERFKPVAALKNLNDASPAVTEKSRDAIIAFAPNAEPLALRQRPQWQK